MFHSALRKGTRSELADTFCPGALYFDFIGAYMASPLVNPWNLFSAMPGQYLGHRKHSNSIIY